MANYAPGFNIYRSQPGWDEQSLSFTGSSGLGDKYLGNQYNTQGLLGSSAGYEGQAFDQPQQQVTQPVQQPVTQQPTTDFQLGGQNPGYVNPNPQPFNQWLQQPDPAVQQRAPGENFMNQMRGFYNTGNFQGLYNYAQDHGVSASDIDQAMMSGIAPNWQQGRSSQWVQSQGLAPLRNTTASPVNWNA